MIGDDPLTALTLNLTGQSLKVVDKEDRLTSKLANPSFSQLPLS